MEYSSCRKYHKFGWPTSERFSLAIYKLLRKFESSLQAGPGHFMDPTTGIVFFFGMQVAPTRDIWKLLKLYFPKLMFMTMWSQCQICQPTLKSRALACQIR